MRKRRWVRIAPEDVLCMADLESLLLATECARRRGEIRNAMWKHAWAMLHAKHKNRKHLLAPGSAALTEIYLDAEDKGLARAFVLAVDNLLNAERLADA